MAIRKSIDPTQSPWVQVADDSGKSEHAIRTRCRHCLHYYNSHKPPIWGPHTNVVTSQKWSDTDQHFTWCAWLAVYSNN